MPQVQREMVLFERGEKRRMEQERRRLLQQVKKEVQPNSHSLRKRSNLDN